MAPIVVAVCHASFQQLVFPCRCKSAIARPLLQKRAMDLNDPASYRPISNLSFLSKVVEKVVDGRLSEHIKRPPAPCLPVSLSARFISQSYQHRQWHDRRGWPRWHWCFGTARSVSCLQYRRPFYPHGLITRTLGPSNNFTLLNGWICLHGVLD